MSILIKIIEKRTARGKCNNQYAFLSFSDKGVFDIPHQADVHRRFVLDEIRSLTGQRVHTHGRRRTIAFKKKRQDVGARPSSVTLRC